MTTILPEAVVVGNYIMEENWQPTAASGTTVVGRCMLG
jgi:hypothetical protein